ncbi:MAG TPA: NAD(P)-dependent oxidoreductase [Bacteroidales bacterium]|nr:NAD(P)-dependent oxidoreductase [Bacteroidales bacterium]
MKKVLILDPVHPVLPESLARNGYTCELRFQESRQELEKICGGYFGLIVRSRLTLDREFLVKASGLRFIGRVGSGMENIDVEFALKRGIRCFNSPEGNRDSVGEHAVGMLLALLNRLMKADREVKNGRWDREGNRGMELNGMTVGIIGYGNMGSAFAARLNGFGVRVISYDKYKQHYSDGNTEETTLPEIFRRSDVVSLHVPLTEETRYLADERFFGKFEKNIWLLNTSRGPVVQTRDLVKALQTGKVLGAALDVLEYEDTSFESLSGSEPEELRFLKQAPNVILTPHIAGSSSESPFKMATVLVKKILEAFPGTPVS